MLEVVFAIVISAICLIGIAAILSVGYDVLFGAPLWMIVATVVLLVLFYVLWHIWCAKEAFKAADNLENLIDAHGILAVRAWLDQ